MKPAGKSQKASGIVFSFLINNNKDTRHYLKMPYVIGTAVKSLLDAVSKLEISEKSFFFKFQFIFYWVVAIDLYYH